MIIPGAAIKFCKIRINKAPSNPVNPEHSNKSTLENELLAVEEATGELEGVGEGMG